MKNDKSNIRSQPAYGVAEAARYLRLPPATLRTWLTAREGLSKAASISARPLIRPACSSPTQLSFYNLVEAHVLRALRTDHGVALGALRKAISFAEDELKLDCLLLSPELRTHAGEVFLDRYSELINLSASGQLAMRKIFEDHLQRVEWDAWKFPVRLYPYLYAVPRSMERPIAIDPLIAFGRPVLQRNGISIAAITDRLDAGESVQVLAEDYEMSPAEIEQAVLYARAA